MAENTKVEWCDHTFNPWMGCTKVAPGCQNCYAEAMMDKRLGKVQWGPNGTRKRSSDANWKRVLKWNRTAEIAEDSYEHASIAGGPMILPGEPKRPRVFCASLADVFEDWEGPILDHNGNVLAHCDGVFQPRAIPEFSTWDAATMDDIRRDLFALIDATPHLDWLLLTKRPENILKMWNAVDDRPAGNLQKFRDNVQLITSISDQETADKNIPELLKCRELCPVLGVSAEPLLGEVDLLLDGECSDWECPYCRSRNVEADMPTLEGNCWLCHDCGNGAMNDAVLLPWTSLLDWVIVGGESGPNARPCTIGHVRSLVDQCTKADVPVFVKQLGANPVNREGERCPKIKHPKGGDMSEWDDDLQRREFPKL